MRNLKANGEIDLRDFLERVDVLAASGMTVLIFELLRVLSACRLFVPAHQEEDRDHHGGRELG